uniref:zinc-finger homeodomain protein 1 n=1 Tax=Erigeron canadensis TaxID=72917 RepID=UPI001CB89FE6|nr:zinc-finger homeodomain protein 1 [Erigeron canadensis]
MELDELEEEQETEGASGSAAIQLPPPNYGKTGKYRFRECLKNHAVGLGGHAVDGCGEFMAAGDDGTLDALKCAACNCHRNFHRKETEPAHHHVINPPRPINNNHQYLSTTPYNYNNNFHHPAQVRPSGYLQITPSSQQRPLALPSTSREDLDEISNPSSSGGGGGGSGSGSRKRFRTKFTQDQKDKMLGFSESLGWKIQKQDEPAVQQFCAEIGVKRHVLKVWMHNNKHTIG